jgi:hypothetical protein
MTWAQKSAQQAEQEKQRQVSEQEEAERQQRESEAQAEALATKLSPTVTKLLEETGDALFGRGGLFNARLYNIRQNGVVWRLEPTQGVTYHVTVDDETSKYVDFFCISVTLVALRDQHGQYCFRVEGYKNSDWYSRRFGRQQSKDCGTGEPFRKTQDLLPASLIAELQKIIYSHKKEMIRLKGQHF